MKNNKWIRFWNIQKHSAGGFTLVELIVVIAILAILAGVAVPAYSGYIKKAEQAADDQLLAALNTAYAAACMENGEFDMRALSFNPKATLSETGVTMNKYDDSFQRYFEGNGAFKYYDYLGFVDGVFKGNTKDAIRQVLAEMWQGNHSFKADGAVEDLLGVFGDVSGIFAGAPEGGIDPDFYLSNFSEALHNATGLREIFGDLFNATNLSDAQLDAYLADSIPGYEELSDGEKAEKRAQFGATIKGNAAVMEFAKDAAVTSPDKVKNDVGSFVSLMQNALDPTWQQTHLSDPAYFENYYLSTLSSEEREAYKNADPGDKQAALNGFLNTPNNVGLTGMDAAAMSKAAELAGATNTSGISTLGSLYALSAGYYESTGKTPPASGLHTFDAFANAVKNDPEGFFNYYSTNGAADVDAYLAFMGALSAGEVDMTNPDAFGGMSDYISGIIGND